VASGLQPTARPRAGSLGEQTLQAVDLLGLGPEERHKGRRWSRPRPNRHDRTRDRRRCLRVLQLARELVQDVRYLFAFGIGGLRIEPTGKAKAADTSRKAAEVVGGRGLIDTC
jgi:hypothetical protein